MRPVSFPGQMSNCEGSPPSHLIFCETELRCFSRHPTALIERRVTLLVDREIAPPTRRPPFKWVLAGPRFLRLRQAVAGYPV